MKIKNTFYSVFMFLIFGFANAQTKTTNQNKEPLKKGITAKDSLKLAKPTPATEAVLDTIIVPKGRFKPFKTNAHASYYADRFHGKKTASGKLFDMNKYTCAHKKLPFGTMLKVTNEKNGKFVIVEVTDRGPFVKGRELDLSRKAFKDIASSKGAGAVIVTIEQLQK